MRTSDLFMFGLPVVLVGFGLLARWYSAWSTRSYRDQQRRQGAAE